MAEGRLGLVSLASYLRKCCYIGSIEWIELANHSHDISALIHNNDKNRVRGGEGEVSPRRRRYSGRAVRDGDAVFLCGAGVSFRVGLPSFKRLTEQVYERLGEVADDEPGERNALESKEYDRALRSLEKRTHRPGTESRVRKAVTELLAAPAMDFPDHRALLQLSKDSEGRPRLLTTNFDTLFERAATAAGMRIPSHAGKSIPKAGRERWKPRTSC
jgi:hypothetical protein